MFTPKVTTTGIVFASLLLMASGLWFSAGEHPQAQAQEAMDSRLKVLLKEKLSILQEVVSQTTKLYQAKGTSLSQVREATQAMHNAELDLCNTGKERVAVLEKMLAEAKDYEKFITEAATSNVGVSAKAASEAKVNRLDVEIALERAKGK